MTIKKAIILLCTILPLQMQGQNLLNEKAATIKKYTDEFNHKDNELYKQYIANNQACEFLIENIPFFECPDKELEKTYYFRWWTYRKHIKQTPNGFVITEFLPDVPWAGKYNTISCAAYHHFYEGRWLKDSCFLQDYARFWFSEDGNPRLYSFGAADAIYHYYLVHNDIKLLSDIYDELKKNYEKWEEEKCDSTLLLFWQTDDRDGMEMSVSGQLSTAGKGYRPTINSYMYGEAVALSQIAHLLNYTSDCKIYKEKAEKIKENINLKLWDKEANFYKVIPITQKDIRFSPARELIGYIPWLYDIPSNDKSIAWKQLFDPEGFAAPYGPTTVEQRSPDFKISYEGHECQWNGPSWPYLTSMTIKAFANYLNNKDSKGFNAQDYLQLLNTYSNSQRLVTEKKDTLCWIDENLNPYTGDWISRTRLKQWKNGNWDESKGGIERGKDYNHSSFCDLIITGLVGLRPQDDGSIVINPLIPKGYWDYFCLSDIYYQQNKITILYDKNGTQYNKGKGFMIFINNKLVHHTKDIQKVLLENNHN